MCIEMFSFKDEAWNGCISSSTSLECPQKSLFLWLNKPHMSVLIPDYSNNVHIKVPVRTKCQTVRFQNLMETEYIYPFSTSTSPQKDLCRFVEQFGCAGVETGSRRLPHFRSLKSVAEFCCS